MHHVCKQFTLSFSPKCLLTSQISEILQFKAKSQDSHWQVKLCILHMHREFNDCYPPRKLACFISCSYISLAHFRYQLVPTSWPLWRSQLHTRRLASSMMYHCMYHRGGLCFYWVVETHGEVWEKWEML